MAEVNGGNRPLKKRSLRNITTFKELTRMTSKKDGDTLCGRWVTNTRVTTIKMKEMAGEPCSGSMEASIPASGKKEFSKDLAS